MRRILWIKYKWVNMAAVGDIEPIYSCSGLRPIEESVEAAAQFDVMHNARMFDDSLLENKKSNND
jgi:hypothetical protein